MAINPFVIDDSGFGGLAEKPKLLIPIPSLSDRPNSNLAEINFTPGFNPEPRTRPIVGKLGTPVSITDMSIKKVESNSNNMFSEIRNKVLKWGIPVVIFIIVIGFVIKIFKK